MLLGYFRNPHVTEDATEKNNSIVRSRDSRWKGPARGERGREGMSPKEHSVGVRRATLSGSLYRDHTTRGTSHTAYELSLCMCNGHRNCRRTSNKLGGGFRS